MNISENNYNHPAWRLRNTIDAIMHPRFLDIHKECTAEQVAEWHKRLVMELERVRNNDRLEG